VLIEQDAHVAGDVVTVLGNLRIQGAAQVRGDATAVGGTVRRSLRLPLVAMSHRLEGPAGLS
jgi:hypothetical protein